MKGPDVDTPSTDLDPGFATPNTSSEALLEMRKVTKRFPGVVALSEVDFDMRAGEVHALVGENGAGKSTLIKILAGVYQPDSGEMTFRQQRYAVSTPRQARDAGIVTIHQELNLVAQMSVTENIFLGTELQRGPLLDRQTMHARARALLARLHLDIDPTRAVGGLGVGQQQMVEVAKALHLHAHLIIMDEPTASLSKREIDDLFQIVADLKRQGVSIIFISHHLEETFDISDRTTVLRDGRHIGTMPTTSLTVDSLIRMMVGRELSEQIQKHTEEHAGREVLRVEGLTRAGTFWDIDLVAHAGEIVGIAGMVGAGRTEVVRAIFGADPVDSGRVFLDGELVDIKSPQDAIRHGMALLTEDRKGQGLVLQFNVRENISLAVLGRLTPRPWTSAAKESSLAAGYIDRLSIKASSQQQLVVDLSGGTQQKVVLSKWLATTPRVLIFDEPTRGIDVGAKAEIYRIMSELATQGVTILMVSSELLEILAISDRIIVMQGGRIRGELTRAEATQERIIALATTVDEPVLEPQLVQGS